MVRECKTAYYYGNEKKLIRLCDEIFKIDPENSYAFGYKGIALFNSGRYDDALQILENGVKLHPDEWHILNNLAMVYYELGEYEKSLKCCDEGLKHKRLDWLCENKIKALLKLNRKYEAWGFFKEFDPDDEFLIEYFMEEEDSDELDLPLGLKKQLKVKGDNELDDSYLHRKTEEHIKEKNGRIDQEIDDAVRKYLKNKFKN